MQRLFLITAICLATTILCAQTPGAMKVPDFIQPTPEVSALLKADNLSVSFATGSPNINIPLGNLSVNGIKLPITLSYNSTGIKVDEYSSMVGAGWNCSSGGVVSRTIFDKPDEDRDLLPSEPTNLNNPNFSNQDAALLEFLKNTPDAESDIFSFSFLNYSGKFILDSLRQHAILMSNYNVKVNFINGDFRNGFIIVTDDGTSYRFEDAEVSKSRSPQGSNCPRDPESSYRKTSWYLTKITAPNKRSYISFTYLTQDIIYEQSITQYISKCTSSENYPGGVDAPCNGAAAETVGAETFYTCIPRQLVTSKFISKVVTSANDSLVFTYDNSMREDLDSAKRLSRIKLYNRNGLLLRQATFYDSYSSGSGSSSYTNSNKRMYLDSLKIDNVTDSTNSLTYKFEYIDRNNVSARLTFMQDLYGYSNGKTSNSSLIPILPSTDINHGVFPGDSTSVSVSFGNRSIDTVYAVKGLLNKIIYPTGGYDSIIYRANKYYNGTSDILAGGSSVSSINSYSFGSKVLEKNFLYIDSTTHSSTFLITSLTNFSDQATLKKNGFMCGSTSYCVGPSYTIASISSNLITPTTTQGSQHAYHRNVIEKIVGSTNNGYTEHHYEYFNGGNLVPENIFNNHVLSAPLRVVNEFVIGEDLTRIYRYDTATSTYKIQKWTKSYLSYTNNYRTYYNYVIKNNFSAILGGVPPYSCEFEPFDVARYPIHIFDVYVDSTKEIAYDTNNDSVVVRTKTEHGNSLHSYPTKETSYTSNGDTIEVRKTYPLDSTTSVLTARNIVAPVLIEKTFRNSILLSTVSNTYYNWFNDSSVVALQTTEYKEQSNSIPFHVNYFRYDTLGNVQQLAKDSGAHKTYIWGYSKQLPIAVVTNADTSEVYYNSFEESGGTTDSNAKTGGKSYSGNYSVSFSLPNGKSYIITYWTWNGTDWIYNQAAYTGSTTLTGTKIDEVRIFPAGAQMMTFTYEPLLGITSQCDLRNQVSYYEYDSMGRLKLIRDAERKIVKLFDYKYQQ